MALARWLTPSLLALAALVPASASGAVTVGQSFTPTSSSTCGSGTYFQRFIDDGNSYVIPNPGRIVSWSHRAGTGSGQIRLVILRLGPGGGRVAIAKSAYETITANALNTFPTDLAVEDDDRIALELASSRQCPTAFFDDFSTYGSYPGETDIGDEHFYFESSQGYRLSMSAVHEPAPFTPGSGGGGSGDPKCPPPLTPYQGGCIDDRPSVELLEGRSRANVRLSRKGSFSLPRLKIFCPSGPACTVTTSITATFPQSAAKKRKVKLGGSKFSVKGGKNKRVSAKVGKKGRRLIGRLKKVKAKMTVRVKRSAKGDTRDGASGDTRTVDLVLRPYRAKR